MLEYIQIVFTFEALLTIAIGTIAGVAIGGMPGLTATMAVGLLVPFTYTMDPTMGLMLLGGYLLRGHVRRLDSGNSIEYAGNACRCCNRD